MLSTNRPVEILLVEDNPGDVRLTREALKESKIPANLSVAEDGIAALGLLLRADGGQAFYPDLILLDLNLPRMSGMELLARLKESPVLRAIPVIVLSSSADDADIREAYGLHANCYVVKPVDLDQFLGMVQGVEEFWTGPAVLPEQRGRATPPSEPGNEPARPT